MWCKAGRSSVLVLIASVGAGFVSLGAGPLAPLLTTLAGPLLGGSITDCTPLAPCPAPVPPTIDGTDPANALFTCTGADCTLGKFTKPVAEPTITYTDSAGTHTVMTQQKCVIDADLNYRCKPAAAAIVLLNNDKLLFWNNLEGTENVELSIVAEYGTVSANDQTRVLNFTPDNTGNTVEPAWARPSPIDAGANPNGDPGTPLLPGGLLSTGGTQPNNEGALFCSDQVSLVNGQVLAAGGTNYYSEPGVAAIPFGLAELEGLKNARLFNPANNTWTQTGSMNFGRWYPSLVTMPNGDVFIASGVTKLIKPIYPQAPTQSGRNVVQTEIYDHVGGGWTDNGGLAQKSLPLFPRLHLLPNGNVFYDAGGQSFNPVGQAYDQALWNIVSAYDPVSKSWTDLGYAGLPLNFDQLGLQRVTSALNVTNPNLPSDVSNTITGALQKLVGQPMNSAGQLQALAGAVLGPDGVNTVLGSGFRGSTFSIMMPLKPDDAGNFSKAEFLTAGGVLAAIVAPSPGTYFATALSRIDTVTIPPSGPMSYASRLTGSFNNARWYSTAVLLPDGSVMAFNGANRDEVVFPGFNNAVQVVERFDPVTETWSSMASSRQQRTYHNTALLLPDARVLVGGHAPISTAYLSNLNLAGLGFAPNDGRDPSFEIYSPPYVFRKRPKILSQSSKQICPGQQFTVTTDTNPITSAILVRRTAITHLVDGDQRAVMLKFNQPGAGGSMQLVAGGSKNIYPPGDYMLFLNRTDTDGTVVPSVSAPVHVGDASSCP